MGSTVADALLDQLADHGVRTCFGVPGVHNLPFWVGAGIGRRPRVVGVRHEQAAGYAADASARATGGLGVALTTTGPGFANALAAFGEAFASFSPVLLISSEAPLGPRRTSGYDDGVLHGMRSQADAVTAGFGARAVSASTGEQAVHALPELAAHALATGRPAYLGVPADVLSQQWAAANPPALALEPASPPRADVFAAAEALRGRRVVVWVGARAVGAEEPLRHLVDRLGAQVVVTFQARGLLADHPGTITAPPHEPVVASIVGGCDTLLVVGDDLAGMTTRNWRMPVPATIVAVTDDARLSLGDYALASRVVGDVATSVEALLEALGAGAAPPAADDVSGPVLDAVATDPRTAPAATFLRTVEEGWPDAGCVVVDMCVAGYWLGAYSRQPRPRRLLYPVGWGTLGFGLPAGIGPAAHGIATLAVVGDGGAAMALGELATYAQERLPISLLVVSDGGYGMLRFDQVTAGDPERGVHLVEPRWEDIASAYGMTFSRTDDPGLGLARALASARDDLTCGDRRLIVLEAAFHPPRTTSPRWRET